MKMIEIEGVSFVANKVVAVGPVDLSIRHTQLPDPLNTRLHGFFVYSEGNSVFVRVYYYIGDVPLGLNLIQESGDHCEKARQNFIKMLKEYKDETIITGGDITDFLPKGTGG